MSITFCRAPSLAALGLFISLIPVAAVEAAGSRPDAPDNLQGAVDDDIASLSWSVPPDDDGVEGYNVYRNNRYLTTVFDNRHSVAIDPDTPATFYVVAFDAKPRNFSARSASITLPDRGPIDTTIAPQPPTELSGTVEPGSDDDRVTLRWNEAVDDQAVAGYNIYRDDRYIATRFQTEYQGTVAAGSSVRFAVVAFDFDGNFSVASESLVLPEGSGSVDPGVPPSIPTGFAATTDTADGQTTVTLSWDASSGPVPVAGYNIYRNNGYRTTVFTTRFDDTVAAGEAFSYAVVAFDGFGNFSPLSARLNILGSENQAPFFSDLGDRTLTVGQPFELRLSPVDLDGGAAGILTSALPAGMENVDNRDGTRSLRWLPAAAAVGSYEITLTAFDLADTDLRTSQSITLTVVDDDTPPDSAPFTLSIAQAAYNLREGDNQGVDIPVTVTREPGSSSDITLSLTSDDDVTLVSSAFAPSVLAAGQDNGVLTLNLAIDVLPIRSQQRRFTITASDGATSSSVPLTIAVTPVQRDDVYLLIGQSNMVGFSEMQAKRAGPGEADEPNLRILQLNATANERAVFASPPDYSSVAKNLATPVLVPAEDPLHVPVDVDSLGKEGTTVGLGLSFAKRALANTTRSIVLVPAAWAGSGFCASAPADGHWNATVKDNPDLGNTLLFDRALTRVNAALAETGGILRGILWHQGEADANSRCADEYQANLLELVAALRTRIDPDERGESVRGSMAAVPFVVGTLSRGVDERGDFSQLDASEMTVDNVHRIIASLTPYSEVSLHDDLVPANGYPCGEGSCIHFGSEALREMGLRYFDALTRAAANTP